MNDCNLQHLVNTPMYLGILLDNKLSWSSQIRKQLLSYQNFTLLKQNLSSCSPEVKASAYLTIQPSWPSLQVRRKICRLQTLF